MYGPYSWHRAFRGSMDDLCFATLSQSTDRRLDAMELRLTTICARRASPNPLLDERVVHQREIGGACCHPLHWNGESQEAMLAELDVAGPSSDNARAVATQAEDVEPSVAEESELCSSKRVLSLQVSEWIIDATTEEDGIWRIIPEHQMQDPQIRFIRESYTASKEDQEIWLRQ
eukprot:702580-Pleurochrysis_carterae.AAC.2